MALIITLHWVPDGFITDMSLQGLLSMLAWGPWTIYGLSDMGAIYGVFTAIGRHIVFDQGPKISLGGFDHRDNTDKRKES